MKLTPNQKQLVKEYIQRLKSKRPLNESPYTPEIYVSFGDKKELIDFKNILKNNGGLYPGHELLPFEWDNKEKVFTCELDDSVMLKCYN